MHIVISMANNTSTPYFTRFAKENYKNKDVKLSFIILLDEKPEMIEEMKAYDFDVHWLTFPSNGNKKIGYVKAFFKALKLLRKIKPDLLHTHLFDDSLPLLFAAKMIGLKHRVITKLDAGYHYHFTPKMMRFDRFNNKNASHLVTVSGENKNFVIEKEGANAKDITLIHQGFPIQDVTVFDNQDRNKMKETFQFQENNCYLLSVARFVELKGQKYIIDAVKQLVDQGHQEYKLILVGYGPDKEALQDYVKELQLEENVLFSDWISRTELNALYQLCDIYIHASLSEPFGFVIAEAMVNEIPIVATLTGAAGDVIEDQKNGLIVDTKNAKAIVDAVVKIKNKTVQIDLEDTKKKAVEAFSIESMWSKHVALYKKLLNV